MLFAKLFSKWFIRGTKVFSDDLFGDVATNVFSVVALFLLFGLLCLGLKNLHLLTLLVVGKIGSEVKDKRSLFIDGSIDKLTEKRIVGS